jgi:hypothetical protein
MHGWRSWKAKTRRPRSPKLAANVARKVALKLAVRVVQKVVRKVAAKAALKVAEVRRETATAKRRRAVALAEQLSSLDARLGLAARPGV